MESSLGDRLLAIFGFNHCRRMPRFYSGRPSVSVGKMLIFLGILAVAAGITFKVVVNTHSCDWYAYESSRYCLENLPKQLYTGIWCGSMFIFFGLWGILSGKHQTKCTVAVHGVFSALAILFALTLTVHSGINIGFSFDPSVSPPNYRPYTIEYIVCSDSYDSVGEPTPAVPYYNWRLWETTSPNYYWGYPLGGRTTDDYNIRRGTTSPNYYWGYPFGGRTTDDYNIRRWNYFITESWNRGLQSKPTALSPSDSTESGTTGKPAAAYTPEDFVEDDEDRKRKKRSNGKDCYERSLHGPWLTQLVMSCVMALIGILVFCASFVTATLAWAPFCCAPKLDDVEGGKKETSPAPTQTCNLAILPDAKQEVNRSSSCLSEILDDVTVANGDDVPLLREGSNVLHV